MRRTAGRCTSSALTMAVVATLWGTGAAAQVVKISYPDARTAHWDGRVRGTGCRRAHAVEVYIRTDTEYLQGKVRCGSATTWSLDRTFPTKGALNNVFARLVSPAGREVSRSRNVAVDMRGALTAGRRGSAATSETGRLAEAYERMKEHARRAGRRIRNLSPAEVRELRSRLQAGAKVVEALKQLAGAAPAAPGPFTTIIIIPQPLLDLLPPEMHQLVMGHNQRVVSY